MSDLAIAAEAVGLILHASSGFTFFADTGQPRLIAPCIAPSFSSYRYSDEGTNEWAP
jgi:hypothetical protein